MLARLLPHLQTGVWTWPIFLLRHLLLLTIGGCNDNDDNDDDNNCDGGGGDGDEKLVLGNLLPPSHYR